MTVAHKLQIKQGQSVYVGDAPPDVELGLPATREPLDPAAADAVLVFCTDRSELSERRGPVLAAAQRDALAWVAYPKAGRLGTDLNRDSLAELMRADGVRPVRQVAIDDTWSALRFRGL